MTLILDDVSEPGAWARHLRDTQCMRQCARCGVGGWHPDAANCTFTDCQLRAPIALEAGAEFRPLGSAPAFDPPVHGATVTTRSPRQRETARTFPPQEPRMRERDMTSDEQVLAEATKQAVQAAGGLEVCARETGKSTSQLSRCSSKFEPDSITIRDANIIESIAHGRTGHPHILRARARLLGYLLVELPEVHDAGDTLAALVTDLACELGDVAQAVREATSPSSAGGRDVTKTEREAVLAQLDDLDQVSARLRLTIKQMAGGEGVAAKAT